MSRSINAIRRVPSVCQRCYHAVPRFARNCPDCGEPLQRISIYRIAYVLIGSLLVFAAMVFAAVLLYRIYSLGE